MMTATVEEIQKDFPRILKGVGAGEKITITRRGVPVASLTALDHGKSIKWPGFHNEAVELKGRPLSGIVIDDGKDFRSKKHYEFYPHGY